jgi:phage gp29-like protein
MNFRTLKAINRWRDSNNPLRGLTMPRAVSLMEQAQRGIMADLQWLYAAETGIEATDPDLMVIIERTLAGVADCEWEIALIPEDSLGFDRVLATEQAAFLKESYAQCDNLDDALEHLVMARFRGFAHVQPWLSPDWSLEHLEPLPQHNMVRNGSRDEWAWNPRADQTAYTSMPAENLLTPDDYLILRAKRPVNRIGLIKYVRSTVSEKDWDGYVEIYGIPGVFIIMPQNVPQGKEEEYADKAEEAAEAGSGALPNGSDVKTLSEARGTQPFQMRLEWLQKQLVLAGTGGLLTMLTESGSGTLAGGAHMSAWDQIIRRVARGVAKPLHQQYDRRALAARFPDRPAQAYFNLRARQEKDVGKVVTNISTLANVGFIVSEDQAKKETGYDVRYVAPAAPVMPGLPVMPTAATAASEVKPAAPVADVAATALNGAQVQSMVELLQQAASGAIPRESILPILKAAFPMVDLATLQQIVGPLATFSAPQAIARFYAVCRITPPDQSQDALMQSGADALAQAQAVASRPLALAIARVLTAKDFPAMQAAAKKLRDDLPQIAATMLSDPAQAEAYTRIMSTAFLQGLIKEPVK